MPYRIYFTRGHGIPPKTARLVHHGPNVKYFPVQHDLSEQISVLSESGDFLFLFFLFLESLEPVRACTRLAVIAV